MADKKNKNKSAKNTKNQKTATAPKEAESKANKSEPIVRETKAPVNDKKDVSKDETAAISKSEAVEKETKPAYIEEEASKNEKVVQDAVPQKKQKSHRTSIDDNMNGSSRHISSDNSAVRRKKSKKSKKRKSHEARLLRIATSKDAPFNYAEAYRALRTNINFIASTEDVKSIVVTSALPKESKSNCAINIAVSLATEGKKVILVDCDLRKPVVHSYLKIGSNRQGLTEILAGKAELDDCILKFKDIKINVLTTGAVPPNPSELLSQERMKALVKTLEQKFDYVIIDAPPVSVVTDPAILASYADGVVLVVRSKFASIEVVRLAKKRLIDVNAKILGVVITRYDAKRSSKNTGYSYSYDYNYYEE